MVSHSVKKQQFTIKYSNKEHDQYLLMMTEKFCGHVQANKALAVSICKTKLGEKTGFSTRCMPVVEQYIAGFQCLLYDLILFL